MIIRIMLLAFYLRVQIPNLKTPLLFHLDFQIAGQMLVLLQLIRNTQAALLPQGNHLNLNQDVYFSCQSSKFLALFQAISKAFLRILDKSMKKHCKLPFIIVNNIHAVSLGILLLISHNFFLMI